VQVDDFMDAMIVVAAAWVIFLWLRSHYRWPGYLMRSYMLGVVTAVVVVWVVMPWLIGVIRPLKWWW
jgi:hypothetical protein